MGNYGAAVSQKGFDVKTCADRFLIWSSAFQNLKIFNRYSVSTTVPAGADNIITITHNLGYYAPFFVIYNNQGNNEGQFMLATTSAVVFGNTYARNYPNYFEFSVPNGFDGKPNGTTVYFTVYILLNDLTNISESIINSGTSSGSSSTDYGIKVSKEGFDVKTCTNDQLIFSSSFPNYIVDKIESVSISDGANHYINHNLGYVPNIVVYKELSVDTGHISMAFFQRTRFLIALTDQHIRLLANSSSVYGTYYVIIFKDKLN